MSVSPSGYLPAVAFAAWTAYALPAGSEGLRLVDPMPDPAAVLLMDNGLWRYDDSGGPRCTEIDHVGTMCALPSVWAPFPAAPDDHRQHFFQDDLFRALATSLTPLSAAQPITRDQIIRAMSQRVTGADGLMMGQQQGVAVRAAGRDWVTTPFTGAGVVLISLTEVNGRAVIVETREFGTTLVNQRHRDAHMAFLDGLTLATDW